MMRETFLRMMDEFFQLTGSKEFHNQIGQVRRAKTTSFLVLNTNVNEAALKSVGFDKSKLMTTKRLAPMYNMHGFFNDLSVETSLHVYSGALGAACHASFTSHEQLLQLKRSDPNAMVGSNMDVMFESELKDSQIYMDFLLNPKISPWRELIQCGYNIHYNKQGHPSGISFELSKIPDDLMYSIKGFFIAARQTRERGDQYVKSFAEMVRRGMDPRTAYLLCVYVHEDHNGNLLFDSNPNNTGKNNGGHWAISLFPYDYGTELNRYYNGKMKRAQYSSTLCVNYAFSVDDETLMKKLKGWPVPENLRDKAKELFLTAEEASNVVKSNTAKVVQPRFAESLLYLDMAKIEEAFISLLAKKGFKLE